MSEIDRDAQPPSPANGHDWQRKERVNASSPIHLWRCAGCGLIARMATTTDDWTWLENGRMSAGAPADMPLCAVILNAWRRFFGGHWEMAAGLAPGNYVFMEADSGVQRAGEVREHSTREGEVILPLIGEYVWSEPLPMLPGLQKEND